MTDAPATRTALQNRRWAVHLGLIFMFLAAFATVGHVLFHFPVSVHSLLGLIFGALIVVHFVQRRHRVSGLLQQLRRPKKWGRAAGRLAWSDVILTFLFVNLIVSGIVDYYRGEPGIFINVGLPSPIRWHALSAILIIIYLIVHVARRASRLRSSRVN